jgi:hypothetical protein
MSIKFNYQHSKLYSLSHAHAADHDSMSEPPAVAGGFKKDEGDAIEHEWLIFNSIPFILHTPPSSLFFVR